MTIKSLIESLLEAASQSDEGLDTEVFTGNPLTAVEDVQLENRKGRDGNKGMEIVILT
jgi:hypothetical protein